MKKELTFTINGVVTDATFSTPASGVQVRLYVTPLGESKKLVSTTTTAMDGFFEFLIKRERIEMIELEYLKVNYFDEVVPINFSDLQVNEDNKADVAIAAKSWVRFNILNQPPISSSDEFKLFKYRGKENCAECCPIGYSYFYGAIDTAVICANDANAYTSFYYWVINTQNFGQDSVYTTPFDTIEYNFVY
jgi:5-hydroxyisourate hydrolase-like protein (transthyretin family)